MGKNLPMTIKEFADLFYNPEKTDPQCMVNSFNVLLDMGHFTRRVKWSKTTGGGLTISDTAKRGKCIIADQNHPDPLHKIEESK